MNANEVPQARHAVYGSDASESGVGESGSELDDSPEAICKRVGAIYGIAMVRNVLGWRRIRNVGT